MCKKERRATYWPSPRPHHYVQLVVTSMLLSIGLWPFVGVKGAFLAFPLWALFELVYRALARQSLICGHCNFDPYLFKFDPELAKKRVEEHFAEKKRKIEARQKELESRFGVTAKLQASKPAAGHPKTQPRL